MLLVYTVHECTLPGGKSADVPLQTFWFANHINSVVKFTTNQFADKSCFSDINYVY